MREAERRKLRWRSRRGMLELDLLLAPFAEEALDSLSREERALYGELLEREDRDLHRWLFGRARPEERFGPLIERIRRRGRRRPPG